MSDYNNKGYEEYNDLHDTSGVYAKRTLDENADPYFSNKSTLKKGIDLKLALKLTTTAASVTLVGGAVAADVIHLVPSSGEEVLPVGTEVTVFLDLGDIGLYNGEKGSAISKYSITNGISLDTKVGDTLPDGKVITSSTKQSFKGWLHYESDGVTVTECDKVLGYRDYIYVATFNDDAPKEKEYTFKGVPTWLASGNYDYLLWAWSSKGTPSKWFEVKSFEDGVIKVDLPVNNDYDGFNICAVYKGSTEGNWEIYSGDVKGRIYYQSKDITGTKGTYEYGSVEWLAFPNNYPDDDEKVLYVFTSVPSYIAKGNYSYFAYAWGGSLKTPTWVPAYFVNDTIMTTNVPEGCAGINLVAAYKGSTEGNWEIYSGDVKGRIYYQSNDIMIASTEKVSVSPAWKSYPSS